MVKDELFEGPTEEQINKDKKCKSSGHGDEFYTGWECPKCGSTNTMVYEATWTHGATMKCFTSSLNP